MSSDLLKPDPLNDVALANGQIIAIKVSENRPLTDKEHNWVFTGSQYLEPSHLYETLNWSFDKLKLFSKSEALKFHEYQTIPTDHNEIQFKSFYKMSDIETTYCIITNGGDDAIVYINERQTIDEWRIVGVFELENLEKILAENQFVNYEEFINSTPVDSNDNEDDGEDNSDYWNRYDEAQEVEEDHTEEKQANMHQVTSDHDSELTRVMLRSHTINTIRDLRALYEDFELDLSTFCGDVMAIASQGNKRHGTNYIELEHIGSHSAAKRHLIRTISTLKKLHNQLYLDDDGLMADIELAIIDIDHTFFNKR